MTGLNPPAWAVVLGAACLGQAIKALLYGLVERKFDPSLLLQSVGLPGLPATVLSCLLTLTILEHGWGSSEAGFVLVFAVIALHDTLKFGRSARRQAEALFHLVEGWPREGGGLAVAARLYLDPRAHHPAHLLVGAMLGALFALAFVPVQG